MAKLRSTLQAQQVWVKAHPAPGCGANTPSSFSHHHPCFNDSMVNAMSQSDPTLYQEDASNLASGLEHA